MKNWYSLNSNLNNKSHKMSNTFFTLSYCPSFACYNTLRTDYLTRAVYSPSSDPVKPVVGRFLGSWVPGFVRACTENLVGRF